MPIQTDLSVSPYFDDFDPNKNFYKILFQPGVSVQARELNQLQSILQNQIERFGDNILKKGTVVDGCNITYHPQLPYVKIRDVESDGAPVNVSAYKDLYIRNSANLQAIVIKTEVGLESSSPNLNTLFVRYQNSGDDFESTQFTASDLLTVFDPKNPIFKININDGSSGFANTDGVVITPAVAVQNSTGGSTFGTFSIEVNDYIHNAGLGTAQIVSVNTSMRQDAIVLQIKPLSENLRGGNTANWTFYVNDTVEFYKFDNPTIKSSANKIVSQYGYGAEGSLITDSLGKVVSISMINTGQGYDVEPIVSISSSTAAISDIAQFNATAQRYLTTVSVAPSNYDPIGSGYGITVSDGVIYQKGHFVRVDEQLTVVEKYSNTGFDKSVGFYSVETLVDSNADTSLLDNATGTPNYTAPGADRLKITPTLTVLDKDVAEANNEFFSIVDFTQGSPYKQSRQTVYSTIGDVIAERTFEESGNYVLDRFNLTTKADANTAKNANTFNIYVDPGVAYINGYKVKTQANYIAPIDKGTDVAAYDNAIISMFYGNYFRVEELGGAFNFAAGELVEFYDTPAKYLSSSPGATIASVGNKIGQARIRAVLYEYGSASIGSPNASYKLYVFDVKMSAGATASSIKSIYYPGTNTKGIADVILDNGSAVLYDTKDSSMLFKSVDATKSLDNVNYIYRNSTLVTSVSSSGTLTVANGANESFPYTSTGAYLSDLEESTINIIPLVDISAAANAAGSVTTSATNAIVTGTSTVFKSAFVEGDYIKIANSSTSFVGQIARINSETSLTLTSNAAGTIAGANVIIYYPKNVSIPLTRDSTKRAKITTTAPVGRLQIELGTLAAGTSANVVVEYNISRNFNVVPKSTSRGAYARITVADNEAGANGPWALGVADVFRLRNVYRADGSTRTNNIITNTGVADTTDFISIANNPYANGDVLTYVRPTSNTANIGLANTTSYYVVFANSSGIKLSATYNGSVVNVYSNTSVETHTLSGKPIHFTPDTFGVTDITNEFYIDSNQTVDYLDTSYLMRKPNLSSIGANDVLLVKFDSFITSTDGIKTINSYDLDDTLTYDALLSSSKVNTLEIPEIFDNSTGKYYDLRDYLDIRPVSANTIPLINTDAAFSNTMILNPREPVDGVFANVSFNASSNVSSVNDFITISPNPFVDGDQVIYNVLAGNTAISPLTNNNSYYVISANTTGVKLSSTKDGVALDLTSGSSESGHVLTKTMLRFSQAAKYFPLPGVAGQADIEAYLGRIDRVVLTNDGQFRTIRGSAGVYDTVPTAPTGSMTINVLTIPPYPSVPFDLGSNGTLIADTMVYNQKPGERLVNYKVATQLTAGQISSIQIKPYKMADIAALEKRISNLEYYVSSTLAETVARSRYIPSSSDASVDRFKFGFFVDAFADTKNADISNPEYSATIENDMLSPKTETVNIEFTFDLNSDGIISESLASFVDTEFTLISQPNATVDSALTNIPTETTGDGTDTVTTPVVTQSIISAIAQYRNSNRNMNFSQYEDWSYTFSSLPGRARLYIDSLDNKSYVAIYQSSTPNDTSGTPILTSLSIIPLTDLEKGRNGDAYDLTTISGGAGEYFENHGNGWFEDWGKLVWNHNPVNGNYYTIRVYKGGKSGDNAPGGFYAFKLYYPVDVVGSTTKTVVGPTSFTYDGNVYNVSPQTFTFSQPYKPFMGIFGGSSDYIADSQRFDITVTGLKPLTRHYFYFDDNDKTGSCQQLKSDAAIAGTQGLISDSNGILSFTFFYDAGINEATTDFQRQAQLAAQIAGIKSFSVSSSDGSSLAKGSIELKYYTNVLSDPITSNLEVPSDTNETGVSMTSVAIKSDVVPWWKFRFASSV